MSATVVSPVAAFLDARGEPIEKAPPELRRGIGLRSLHASRCAHLSPFYSTCHVLVLNGTVTTDVSGTLSTK